MKFCTLQERLRKTLQARIQTGALTGLELARQTGFRQAHICNFLNSKRGLSLEGMDRVLAVQQLSIFDLLKPEEVNQQATTITSQDNSEFEDVIFVDSIAAASLSTITRAHVKKLFKFKKTFLRRLRPEMATRRDAWHRFVLVQVDAHDGMSMHPRLLPGAMLLIDRHYNSLRPYRKKECNMYAVNIDGRCTITHVELAGANLILRPHNQHYPISVVPMGKGNSFADCIIGRVCHISIEV